MVESLLEDVSKRADQKNETMIHRLLKRIEAALGESPCRYCYCKCEYVWFKLTARSLKKKLGMDDIADDRTLLHARLDKALSTSQEFKKQMSQHICLCGGETWDRLERDVLFARQNHYKAYLQ